MKFFLQTGFGDSKDFASAEGSIKTQSMCQSNGAAPAGWTVDSIVMIQAHKQKGHGIHFRCPKTNKTIYLAGTLFVDDTNLEHLDLIKMELISASHKALQDSILNWGRLLLATGGALKPAKCFYHMISFSWKPDGSWKYDVKDKVPELSILVPLGDGSLAPIDHLPVTTPTKTLDQMTCLTGSSKGAILEMKEKSQKWINTMKGGWLHSHNFWFLMDKQFLPRVYSGISSITAPFEELEECMMRTYYDFLPVSGMRWLVNRELRQMDRGFYEGLPYPGVECFNAQLNTKLLTNYGCVSGLGMYLQTSMEIMIVEGGVSTQLLSQSFQQ
jgi:hypothetical protein